MEKKASVKKAVKKPAAKPAKKVTKKAAPKKAVTKKSPVKKASKKVEAKKPVKKVVKPRVKKVVAVKPVTDSTGVVTLKSVDDAGSASQGEAVRVTATVDKETGVVTMAPASE